jgi:hypothetical protein
VRPPRSLLLRALLPLLEQGAQLIDLENVGEAREGGLSARVTPCNTKPYGPPEVEVVHPPPSSPDPAAAAAGNGHEQQQQQQQVLRDPTMGKHLNPASLTLPADIYSLGVVLFELFTDACQKGDMIRVVSAVSEAVAMAPPQRGPACRANVCFPHSEVSSCMLGVP